MTTHDLISDDDLGSPIMGLFWGVLFGALAWLFILAVISLAVIYL